MSWCLSIDVCWGFVITLQTIKRQGPAQSITLNSIDIRLIFWVKLSNTCYILKSREISVYTLTLNWAHNDRTGSSWQPKIAELIKTYPKVYTDISHDTEMWFMPKRYFKGIKRMLRTPRIQDRLLYGTDWYMGRFLWTEKSYLRYCSLSYILTTILP